MTVQQSQEKQLAKALSELSHKVVKIIQSGISSGKLKPQIERSSCRIIDDFRYIDNGVTYDLALTEDIMTSVWYKRAR